MKILVLVMLLTSCSMQLRRAPASQVVDMFEVGDIKSSLLEPREFQELHGEEWVLMDGQDISGSEFELLTSMSTAPDARGKFLRMSNNGVKAAHTNPENKSLGEYQPDSFKSHDHTTHAKGPITGRYLSNNNRLYSGGGGHKLGGTGGVDNDVRTGDTGSSETRPKNITVNFYLKINRCSDASNNCK